MGSRLRNDRFSDAAGSGPAVSGGAKSVHAGGGAIAGFIRASLRLLILAFSLSEVAVRFLILRVRRGPNLEIQQRAQWLNQACGIILRRLGLRLESRGSRPAGGLVCSNHLTYLDILVYAATAPCVFVSKREVRSWPAFGFFASCGGSIFLNRQSRASAEKVTRAMAAVLEAGVPVLLFPEGTSTDGSTVGRFHSTLLQPAVELGLEMTAAAIGYRAAGREEREICWYGDAPFLPHLARTLSLPGVAAEVEFHPDRNIYQDRKAAALELREQVEAIRRDMKREGARAGSPSPS